MRHVDPQIENLLSSDSKMACIMGEIEWPTGIVRFHDGVGTLIWQGESYYGLGGAGSVDIIKEGTAPTIKLNLQTSDAALVSEAIKDDAAGGDVRLYLGVFNENQQLTARQLVYAGLINKTPVRYSAPPTISVDVNSYAHRWNQPKRYTTYSKASQRSVYPNDSFFDDVEAVAKGPLSSYSGSNSVSGGHRFQHPTRSR
ncbi:hypothetical protein KUL42_09900 [Alteromonas sp. KUL42]|uniref:hypothetical protein n=1 Tax=Alteromonas sp. KUL42 TaxID=2480797 RepID=UPI001036120A|nr:hypothetical protein [Alteromonas sp. KUL42]TAP37779.1 hypothetical protein EYR97_04920 [Alteromonas sp. KUL42]GEA06229.1 hypothetical protein KUL42_09900 [Alteromonas sp. KUL42]